MIKFCKECNTSKDVSEFYVRRNRGTGLAGFTHRCKPCVKKAREYLSITKKEYMKKYMKKYRENNKEQLKDYITNWRFDNEEKIKDKRQSYYQNNKKSIKIKNYKYCKERTSKDPIYKLTRGIRSLIRVSLKNKFTTKSKKTIEILGCTFEEFKVHLESKFDDKMNWSNQGTYWHMDHIIPISSAINDNEVYKLNHYTNFQPLYWLDNLKKSNK